MRLNLTKKDLVNSVYMQLGFSKEISENLIEDFFSSLFISVKKKWET
jgi:integration host factor subunit alpha